jgi:rhodanese-related sulfurtransferase
MNYAGDVTSQRAYQTLQADADAVLVDVRTTVEWHFVGVPAIDQVLFIEWTRFPDGTVNPGFLDQLAQADITADTTVFFMCRSGQRSAAAAQAATAAGYSRAFNVSDGFEGPPDPTGKRRVSGWKHHGLPWRQS